MQMQSASTSKTKYASLLEYMNAGSAFPSGSDETTSHNVKPVLQAKVDFNDWDERLASAVTHQPGGTAGVGRAQSNFSNYSNFQPTQLPGSMMTQMDNRSNTMSMSTSDFRPLSPTRSTADETNTLASQRVLDDSLAPERDCLVTRESLTDNLLTTSDESMNPMNAFTNDEQLSLPDRIFSLPDITITNNDVVKMVSLISKLNSDGSHHGSQTSPLNAYATTSACQGKVDANVKRVRKKPTFAMKLYKILSMKECNSAIRWMPNGAAFCVLNSKELVDNVLPQYFKKAKYTSFNRKLNRWGFRHLSLPAFESEFEQDVPIYTHPKFQRDNYSAVCEMNGGHQHRNSDHKDLASSTLAFSSHSAGVDSVLPSLVNSSDNGMPILDNVTPAQHQNAELQLKNTNLLLSKLIERQQQYIYQQLLAPAVPQDLQQALQDQAQAPASTILPEQGIPPRQVSEILPEQVPLPRHVRTSQPEQRPWGTLPEQVLAPRQVSETLAPSQVLAPRQQEFS